MISALRGTYADNESEAVARLKKMVGFQVFRNKENNKVTTVAFAGRAERLDAAGSLLERLRDVRTFAVTFGSNRRKH